MNIKNLHEALGNLLAAGVDANTPVVAISDIAHLQEGVESGAVHASQDVANERSLPISHEPGLVYGIDQMNLAYRYYRDGVSLPRQLQDHPEKQDGSTLALVFASERSE